jgi:hypothetical protein
MRHAFTALFALGIAAALAACSSAAPRQIATYPAEAPPATPAPIAREPYPRDQIVVRNAYLEFEVNDVDAAAGRVAALAYEHGGYPVTTQSWVQDGRQVTTVTLAVPAGRFDELRRRLLDLGTLITERTSSETVPNDESSSDRSRAYPPYTQVTVLLRPAAVSFVTTNGWNPARTFERAFGVVASIFQVVADVLIWVIVVGGPFALVGWGVWALLRRVRRP